MNTHELNIHHEYMETDNLIFLLGEVAKWIEIETKLKTPTLTIDGLESLSFSGIIGIA